MNKQNQRPDDAEVAFFPNFSKTTFWLSDTALSSWMSNAIPIHQGLHQKSKGDNLFVTV